MTKTLIKRQLKELLHFINFNKKTGEIKSKKKLVGTFLLFSFIYLSVIAMFFGYSYLLGDTVLELEEFRWVYFAICGISAIALGAIGSVFSTYNSVFHAKDNDMLLSMPIRPSCILTARLTGVYVFGTFYALLSYLPSTVFFWIKTGITFSNLFFPIISFVFITLFVLTLSCFLGWIVALLSKRVKNKTFFTVLFSLFFLCLYFYFIGGINNIIDGFASNVGTVGSAIKSWGYPFYHLALGATGNVVSCLIFAVFSVVLFVICYLLMSKTFIGITTYKTGMATRKTKVLKVKKRSAKGTLLKKEIKRFTTCSVYLLNCGIGLFFMLILCVVLIIKMGSLSEMLEGVFGALPFLKDFLSVAIISVVCLLSSMNAISSPSISLEGKNFWILKVIPIDFKELIWAKETLHVIFNVIPCIALTVVLCIFLKLTALITALNVAICLIYIYINADIGLIVGIKRPNFNWTSEVIPVKQDISLFISLVGGWVISIVSGGAYYFLVDYIEPIYYIIALLLVFILTAILLKKWLYEKGAKILANI